MNETVRSQQRPRIQAGIRRWKYQRRWRLATIAVLNALLVGCQLHPSALHEQPPSGHIGVSGAATTPPTLPQPVRNTAFIPIPAPSVSSQIYTVVVHEVEVKALLFALARDAHINVDVHPSITGLVTLNAIEQTLDQILKRIARQVRIDYAYLDGVLVIGPARPFLRTYRVDYIHLGRKTTSLIAVSTQINATDSGQAGFGSILNTSTTQVEAESNHQFWNTITVSLRHMILSDPNTAPLYPGGLPAGEELVVPNPENGLIIVRATTDQHQQIQRYLDATMAAAKRQVLVEATVVEVELSDRYRSGIDWQKFANNSGLGLHQNLTTGGPAGGLTTAPFWLITYSNIHLDLSVTARFLQEFGNTKVLSSPKLMVLNNHTATLKAVDNRVFFNIESEVVPSTQEGGVSTVSTKSSVRTVPEGIILTITPQISESGEIIINVRPTISRVIGTVADPAAVAINATNQIPVFRVRELESVLRLTSGQIAVLGGLMHNNVRNDTNAVPLLSKIPFIGELFKSRDNSYAKSELVIFLRPWVIHTPSIKNGDLHVFKSLLPGFLQPKPTANNASAQTTTKHPPTPPRP